MSDLMSDLAARPARPVPVAATQARYRRRWAAVEAALLLTFPLGGSAHAQLLAEVMAVTAIQAQFNGAVSFPRGTLRATGAGVDGIVRRIEGHSAWTEWEAYTLGGVATSLAGAIDHQV